MENTLEEKAKEYLLKIGFDDAHLPKLFNDDDKSYYTIPELMQYFTEEQIAQKVKEALEEAAENATLIKGGPIHSQKINKNVFYYDSGNYVKIDKESILSIQNKY